MNNFDKVLEYKCRVRDPTKPTQPNNSFRRNEEDQRKQKIED